MPKFQEYWEDLVHTLIYNHYHKDSKARKAVVKKKLSIDLDFDKRGGLIKECAEHLEFVKIMGDYVWYEQTEPMLKFVRDETDMKLWEVGRKFSHLTPPGLRDEYNLPKPKY